MTKVDGRKKNNVPPHARIKKGEVRNPYGPQGKTPGMKAMKNLSREELVIAGNLIVKGRAIDLMRIESDEQATSLEKMLGAVVTRIITTGDMGMLNQLLDRLIGKVTDNLHLTGDGNAAVKVVVQMPSNGREAKK